MSNSSIITLKNLTKVYGDKTVVDSVNLDVKKGEFVTFLGPSGCGKTTTLRMIAGFEKPTSGEVFFNGKNIVDTPPHLRNINTVFQKYALFPYLNVFNNIAFGLKIKRNQQEIVDKHGKKKIKKVKLDPKVIEEKVFKALKIVGLTGYEKRDVTSLSGGQQQRVAIARAIVNEPEVLLLDEPLGALDLKMRQEMQLELKQMHKKLGITFIYVTHDQEEALTMSDTVIVMKDGLIYQEGSPTDIYNEPANAFVADFIGESNIFDGKMKANMAVSFCGKTLTCVDSFPSGQQVDVVIRPEDIIIGTEDDGMFNGKIEASIFKGVHYEMTAKVNGFDFLIHNTQNYEVGKKISITIKPDDIHIMNKQILTNEIEVSFANNHTLVFCDGKYEFNPSSFIKNAVYDAENDKITTPDGDLELSDKKAIVSVAFDQIDLADNEDEAPVAGNVSGMVYKGKNYLVTIKIDEDNTIVADTEYLWDDGDRVGITIGKDDFKLVKVL